MIMEKNPDVFCNALKSKRIEEDNFCASSIQK